MEGKVICDLDGFYVFTEVYSKTRLEIRGDKLIDLGPDPSHVQGPNRYEVRLNGKTVGELRALSWHFEELPDQL